MNSFLLYLVRFQGWETERVTLTIDPLKYFRNQCDGLKWSEIPKQEMVHISSS